MVSRSGKITILSLALGHGVTDLYANFLPALLPVFEDRFDLTKSAVGALLFVLSLSASTFQVLYAYLGDRLGRRLFLVPGPAVAAIFMCFVGLSPSFPVLFLLVLLGGMGVSAFHPHAASFVGSSSGEKRGFGLSIFMTVGTAGYALGPLTAAALISSRWIGAARMPFFAVAGIVMSILLYKYAAPGESSAERRSSDDIFRIIRPHIKPLFLLCMIVVLRATVTMVFTNFIPFLMNQRERSLVIGGGVTSLFMLSIAIGTLLGGYLYDKISRRRLLILSLLFSSPLLFAFIYSHGFIFISLLFLSGLMVGCSNPIPLGIAQELMPEGASTASSIMMGLSWGMAGLPLWLFGRLSDFYDGNVIPSMSAAAFLPILAILLVLPLQKFQGD